MSYPFAFATWPPLATVLSAGSVTLTSTVKLDCVLGTSVWSIVRDRLQDAFDGVAVGVGGGVGVAVGVGVGVGVTVGVAVGVGVGVGVAVGAGVGVGVGVAVGLGVGVGVDVAQLSLPIVINVPGELWLLYSVVIQPAERAVAAIRTSSMSPLHGLLPRAPLPITASGVLEVGGLAAVGPATSEPFLYKRRLLPSNVPTTYWRLLVSREPPSQLAPPHNAP